MNEQTEKLIRELAAKLGTTTEHLWQVLTYQAMITGLTNIFLFLFLFCFLWISLKIIRAKTKVPPKTQSNLYPNGQWEMDGPGFAAWALWSVAVATFGIVFLTNFADITSALLNPEYFALQQVLHIVK